MAKFFLFHYTKSATRLEASSKGGLRSAPRVRGFVCATLLSVLVSAQAAQEPELERVPAGGAQSCRAEWADDGTLVPCAERQDALHVDLYLESASATTHWGSWAGAHRHVATVRDGGVVQIRSLTAVNFWPKHEEAGHIVPASMKDIYQKGCPPEQEGTKPYPCGKLGPHLLTGPVHVEGAEVGDVLQVDVLEAEPYLPWGWNLVRPGAGSLKHGFEGAFLSIGLDLQARTVLLPWGGHLPWNITGTGPFFGQMGTAPPPEVGAVSSVAPEAFFGGNIDNKHLGAGATVYFPVNVDGAGFSVGDGHAVQGDGEVCVTALETSLQGRFRLTVRKDLGTRGGATSWIRPGAKRMDQLRAETAGHFITMAFHEELDAAEKLALQDMLTWMQLETGLPREALYRLCSLAADMHVTQVVNIRKGIHILLPKSALPATAMRR